MNVVQFLIAAGADLNVLDRWQSTPYQEAVRHSHTAVARTLRDSGAIDSYIIKDTSLLGKLCSSAAQGNLEEVRKLVELGVDPNQGDYDARTPLHLGKSNQSINHIRIDSC